jgi:hypothetical protein
MSVWFLHHCERLADKRIPSFHMTDGDLSSPLKLINDVMIGYKLSGFIIMNRGNWLYSPIMTRSTQLERDFPDTPHSNRINLIRPHRGNQQGGFGPTFTSRVSSPSLNYQTFSPLIWLFTHSGSRVVWWTIIWHKPFIDRTSFIRPQRKNSKIRKHESLSQIRCSLKSPRFSLPFDSVLPHDPHPTWLETTAC